MPETCIHYFSIISGYFFVCSSRKHSPTENIVWREREREVKIPDGITLCGESKEERFFEAYPAHTNDIAHMLPQFTYILSSLKWR